MLRGLAIVYIYTRYRAFSPPRIVSCLFLFLMETSKGLDCAQCLDSQWGYSSWGTP